MFATRAILQRDARGRMRAVATGIVPTPGDAALYELVRTLRAGASHAPT
jgi:hypothetical protein